MDRTLGRAVVAGYKTDSKLLGTRDDSLRLLAILPQQLAQLLDLVEQHVEIHLMARVHRQGHVHAVHAVHARPVDLRIIDLVLRHRRRRLPGGAGRIVEKGRKHVGVAHGHFLELDQSFIDGVQVERLRAAVE